MPRSRLDLNTVVSDVITSFAINESSQDLPHIELLGRLDQYLQRYLYHHGLGQRDIRLSLDNGVLYFYYTYIVGSTRRCEQLSISLSAIWRLTEKRNNTNLLEEHFFRDTFLKGGEYVSRF